MSIIPTISSGTAGPLGVQHLPRLWQKASLDAAGKLHSDYPAAGAGFDQMTLDALGIERRPSSTTSASKLRRMRGMVSNGNLMPTRLPLTTLQSMATIMMTTSQRHSQRRGPRGRRGNSRAVNLNNLEDWKLSGAEIAS